MICFHYGHGLMNVLIFFSAILQTRELKSATGRLSHFLVLAHQGDLM